MDYDNDGIQDIISGSYDPGDVYLIRGLGAGKYAAVEQITDRDGTPLVHHPVEMKRQMERTAKENEADTTANDHDSVMDQIASFGSWPTPFDWDADGDLDVVIGAFDGSIFLRTNVGNRSKPEYAVKSVQVLADGKPLKEDSHASPVAADWDGDGRTDLVVGSGDGGVVWYRNVGTAKEPKFGPRKLLVGAPGPSIFLTQYVQPGDKPGPGARAQICVHDYNGDGLLDLLVGDHSEVAETDPTLSPSQQEELAQAMHHETQLMRIVTNLQMEYMAAVKAGTMDMEQASVEMGTAMEKKQEEYLQQVTPMSEETQKLFEELSRNAKTVSQVWLYLRTKESGNKTAALAP